MNKHTPGPWFVEGEVLKTAINSKTKHIAMVNYFDCGSGDPRSISKEEHEANSNLIASAPFLLLTLEWIKHNVTIDNPVYDKKDLKKRIQAAINLAKIGTISGKTRLDKLIEKRKIKCQKN